jgi:dCTP deaminase
MLTGPEIRRQMTLGEIAIDPPPVKINPNSVNLRLGRLLKVYAKALPLHQAWEQAWQEELERRAGDLPGFRSGVYLHGARWLPEPLDCKVKEETVQWEIPEEGQLLWPGILYLAHTLEHTETRGFIPVIEGRSGVARYGIQVHLTAGFGDQYFRGDWTLEVVVVHPIRIYHGMQVCQIAYDSPEGDAQPYDGAYQGQRGPKESNLWKEFR